MISVVIPAHNEEGYLTRCLQAVATQKTSDALEVIVVDNNCTDNSVAVARANGVKVVQEKIPGVGAARRAGVAAATGDIIVTIDADTELGPGYIARTSELIKNNPHLACVGGMFSFYDAPAWKNWVRSKLAHPLLQISRFFAKGKVGPHGNNMVFRKSDYLKTRGFNASLKFGEDMDLVKQLAAFGEVELRFDLPIKTSVRRYMFNWSLVEYTANLFFYLIKGKPWRNRLPRIWK